MREKMIFLLALMVLCTAGFAAAASSSDSGISSTSNAVLQITSYSVVPEKIYPGTSGYATITVQNTGTEVATAVSAYYNYLDTGKYFSVTSGDISSGSSSQISIPFKVPGQVVTGLYTINVDVQYSSGSSGSSKKTSISVPLVLSQYEALEVNTLSSNRKTISPGDSIELLLQIKNKEGVVNDLLVSTPENSSFSIRGTTSKSIGNIASGSSVNNTVELVASSSATVGQYTVPLLFTYKDVLGSTVTQTLYVGPVSILESSSQFRLNMQPITPTEVGAQASFRITLENTGTSAMNAVVDLNETSTFVPLGVTRIYFDSIEPGQNVSETVSIGISSSTSAGYYSLPVSITLGSGKITTQYVGVPVTATPSITFSVDTQSSTLAPGTQNGKVVIQISNTGNAAIRSVYAKAEPKELKISGAADKFIGTLNVDDYASFQLSVSVPANVKSGTQIIPVTVTYKDGNNQQYTVKKDVEVEVGGAGMTPSAGTTAANGFAGARRPQSGLFGFDPLVLGGAGIVLATVAYLAYKRFRKNKQEKKEAHKA